eukprot:XP_001697951.1 ubiquitin-like protein [Chlamydomonas reinhardtii]
MADVKAEAINISIKSTDGEVNFKIKKSTRMGKVFSAFAQKKGVATNHYRFVFDGNRVGEDVTAAEVGLEDGDSIDAFVEQEGGIDAFVEQEGGIDAFVEQEGGIDAFVEQEGGTRAALEQQWHSPVLRRAASRGGSWPLPWPQCHTHQ